MPLARLIGLACAKSRGDAVGIVGIVVVDVAVVVHINEVSGVAAVRRAEPPVDGAAGCGLSQTVRRGLSGLVAPLDFRDLRDFVGYHAYPRFND